MAEDDTSIGGINPDSAAGQSAYASSIFGGSSSSGGIGAAAGITGAVGLAGVALGAMGAAKTTAAEKQEYSDSAAISGLDEQVNYQRQLQMNLQTQRSSMENLRNVQRTKSAGLSASVSSGVSPMGNSSGYKGGQAQATEQGANYALGLNQNQAIGTAIFGLDNSIDQQKIAIANAQSQAATGQGESSLGSSIVSVAGIAGKIGASFLGA